MSYFTMKYKCQPSDGSKKKKSGDHQRQQALSSSYNEECAKYDQFKSFQAFFHLQSGLTH